MTDKWLVLAAVNVGIVLTACAGQIQASFKEYHCKMYVDTNDKYYDVTKMVTEDR